MKTTDRCSKSINHNVLLSSQTMYVSKTPQDDICIRAIYDMDTEHLKIERLDLISRLKPDIKNRNDVKKTLLSTECVQFLFLMLKIANINTSYITYDVY